MQTGPIICQCANNALIPPEVLQALTRSLEAANIPFELVPDLCGLAASKDPRLQDYAATPGIKILACYPRAVQALFQLAGAPLDPDNALLINLRDGTLEQAVAQLGIPLCPLVTDEGLRPSPPANGGWIPWFPVIDSTRCSNCHQCLGFCLFGVYALSPDGKVTVENPQACKTNCPACARICPDVAIMFPKYAEGPINGAPIEDESLEKARVKADLEKILGSDVYTALAERRKKVQQRKLLGNNVTLANAERQKFSGGSDALQFRPRPANPSSTDTLGSNHKSQITDQRSPSSTLSASDTPAITPIPPKNTSP
jgi:NAD-dependent dihydropyrimidine dehydrogenase PreA subunit